MQDTAETAERRVGGCGGAEASCGMPLGPPSGVARYPGRRQSVGARECGFIEKIGVSHPDRRRGGRGGEGGAVAGPGGRCMGPVRRSGPPGRSAGGGGAPSGPGNGPGDGGAGVGPLMAPHGLGARACLQYPDLQREKPRLPHFSSPLFAVRWSPSAAATQRGLDMGRGRRGHLQRSACRGGPGRTPGHTTLACLF